MSYIRQSILDSLFAELSEFEVNDISGTLSVYADVRIAVDLPEDWEFELGEEFVDVRISKEISL